MASADGRANALLYCHRLKDQPGVCFTALHGNSYGHLIEACFYSDCICPQGSVNPTRCLNTKRTPLTHQSIED